MAQPFKDSIIVDGLVQSTQGFIGSGAQVTDVISNNVNYTTQTDATISTVKQALDKLLFVPMTVSLSIGGTTSFENGYSVSSLALSWTISKDIQSQILYGPNVVQPSLSTRNETVTGPFTSNSTWTISAVSVGGLETISSSASISFLNKIYWGISSNSSLTDGQILSLNSRLATSRTQTQTFNPGGSYIYFAWPTSFGEPVFTVGGLVNTAWVEVTRTFVNQYSYSTSYNIYRSTYTQNGTSITIQVT